MVETLFQDQVQDVSRGSFLVGVVPTKQKHLGELVYEDARGRKFIIIEREA